MSYSGGEGYELYRTLKENGFLCSTGWTPSGLFFLFGRFFQQLLEKKVGFRRVRRQNGKRSVQVVPEVIDFGDPVANSKEDEVYLDHAIH